MIECTQSDVAQTPSQCTVAVLHLTRTSLTWNLHTNTTFQQLADFRHALRCFQIVQEKAKYRSCTEQKFRVLLFRLPPYPITLQAGVVNLNCSSISIWCRFFAVWATGQKIGNRRSEILCRHRVTDRHYCALHNLSY